MKAPLFLIATLSLSHSLFAKEVYFLDAEAMPTKIQNHEANDSQGMKILYLTKLLDQQQRSYDDKIAYLEAELRKTKERLIEKSLNQEKAEEAMLEKFNAEASYLKKELAYKTKSLLDYQRQMEKMKPSEDLKNIIQINTTLSSELRRSEDKIAIMQLKAIESMPNYKKGTRLPASVSEEK